MYENHVSTEEQLYKEIKQLAARNGKSLSKTIEDALRESLARQRRSEAREPVHLVTFGGNRLLPGVDLDDSAALLDLMESSQDPGLKWRHPLDGPVAGRK
jgi:hypothetical protein